MTSESCQDTCCCLGPCLTTTSPRRTELHCALLEQLAVQAGLKVLGNMDWPGGHLVNAGEVSARQAVGCDPS